MERHRTSDMRVHLPKRFKSAKNRRGCELGLLAAVACAGIAAFATPGFTTVYENDFSSRTSLTPVPASRWSTTTYKPDAALYYNFTGEAGMSVTHFRRRFAGILHITPARYLATIRINAAIRLLTSTNKLLAEIAHDCGFYDQSHFIRTFKRLRRQTPAQYRRAHFTA